MTITETAAYLKTLNRVLILTHVRPDGDTTVLPTPLPMPPTFV